MQSSEGNGARGAPPRRGLQSRLADLVVEIAVFAVPLAMVVGAFIWFQSWNAQRAMVRRHHLEERWCYRTEGANVDYCLYTRADCDASRDARVTARGRRGPWPGPCRHVEPPWCFSLRVRDPDGRHRIAYSCGATYEGCVRNRDRILTTPDDKRAERGYPEPTGYCLQH